MDSHGLARATVNLIAAGDPAALQLVERRLPGVRASLGTTPLDAAGHARLSAAVADLAEADPVFAESLERALHVRITTNSGPFSGNHVQGDMRVKNRQFHIGRFQFGTGGLVTAVVLFVVLGGGTAAVVSNATKPVELATAVGRWEQAGSSPVSGIEMKPTVLTVTGDGRFTFSLGIAMSMPGHGDTPAVDVQCSGTVTPDGDHFTLRSTAGVCGTFTAKTASDGTIMDVQLDDGSLPLTKVTS